MSDFVSPAAQAARMLDILRRDQTAQPAYTSTAIMQNASVSAASGSSAPAAPPAEQQPADHGGKRAKPSPSNDTILTAVQNLQALMDRRFTQLENTIDAQHLTITNLMATVSELRQQHQQMADTQRADQQRIQELEANVQDYRERAAWMEESNRLQIQALNNGQRDGKRQCVILKPGSPSAADQQAFSKLTNTDLNTIFGIPAGSGTCTITQRVVKRPAAGATPGQPQAPLPRWTPEAPCLLELMEVQLPPTVDVWKLHGKREHREAFRRVHNLQIKPALTHLERAEQQHLQQHAMGALRSAGVEAGWRLGKLTWKVPGTDRFGLLTMNHIPTNCSPDFVIHQFTAASRRAAPNMDIPDLDLRGAAAAGGSNRSGPEATMPDAAV